MTAQKIEKIYVDELGKPSPQHPSLVFIHGLGGTSGSWRPLTDALQATAAPVSHFVLIDLPGAGLSPAQAAQPTIASLVAHVTSVIHGLNLTRIHVVAHSMGTVVAQKLAAAAAAAQPGFTARLEGLSLLAPIAKPTDSMRQRLTARAAAARRDGMSEIAEQVAQGGVAPTSRAGNPLLAAYLGSLHLAQDPAGYAGLCEALAASDGIDGTGITARCLLLAGDEDAIAPPATVQMMADKMPEAEMQILHRCGHWLPLEYPRECAEHISAFLRRASRNATRN